MGQNDDSNDEFDGREDEEEFSNCEQEQATANNHHRAKILRLFNEEKEEREELRSDSLIERRSWHDKLLLGLNKTKQNSPPPTTTISAQTPPIGSSPANKAICARQPEDWTTNQQLQRSALRLAAETSQLIGQKSSSNNNNRSRCHFDAPANNESNQR